MATKKQRNPDYDVIIVGAGPSGLTAAKALAAAQRKVLVLEKKKEVGNKVCAGGLTLKDFEEFNLPQSLIEKEFNYVNLYLKHKLIKLDLKDSWLWTCDRKKLGKYQLTEVKTQGAEVQFNAEVVKIVKDRVFLQGGRNFSFQYLIGADGSSSVVRRSLGLEIKKFLLALQYPVPAQKIKEEDLEILLDLKRFGPTYAWIFPHKNYQAIGAGADPKFISGPVLKYNLDQWCRELGLDPSQYKLQAALINYDYQGIQFGNVFLGGDAAGLASGLTGEGIHPAMVSGQEIAQKIINPDYNFRKLPKVLEAKAFEERVLKFYKANKTITKILFSLTGLLLKNNKFKQKAIKFFTEK